VFVFLEELFVFNFIFDKGSLISAMPLNTLIKESTSTKFEVEIALENAIECLLHQINIKHYSLLLSFKVMFFSENKNALFIHLSILTYLTNDVVL